MGLKELWTGGEEVKKARETRQRLKEKSLTKKLRAREETKLEQSVSITRRQFLNQALAATVVTGSGIAAIYFGLDDGKSKVERSQSTKRPKPTSLPPKTSIPPESTTIELDRDRKIKDVEAGFMRFKEKVLPLLQNIDDAFMRKLLEIPFTLLAHNAKVNKERNVQTFAKNRGHRTDNYSINVYTSQFFYDFARMSYDRHAASFGPSSRKMILSNNFDPNSVIDNLVLFHELMHAFNDSKARMKIKSKEQWRFYQAFYRYEKDGKPKYNLMDEAIAIACELEVLNQLLGGEIEKNIKSGQRLDIRGIRNKLNANNISQIGPLNFNLDAARYYFKGSRKYKSYSKAFLDFIASHARNKGYDVVLSDGTGSISPYR